MLELSPAITRQYIDALSPSNFAMTNPEVFRETVKSHGQNLLKGLNNLLRDGVVTEVDHARHLCRVQTGEAHTDFLPWFSAAAGELRTWAPPSSWISLPSPLASASM